MYDFIKLVHILSAIVAVGYNLSYIIWLLKGKKEQQHLLFALKGIKFLDSSVANPAYIISLLTGVGMWHIAKFNLLHTGWLLYPLVLFGIMGIVSFGFYSPALSKQIKLLETQGIVSDLYVSADKKQTAIGIVLVILALSIVTIMVIKPDLAVPKF